MSALRFTLVAEGTSDHVLIPILQWMLLRHHSGFEWVGQPADLSGLPDPPRGLDEKLATAVELYPAEVLFVHRDSDRELPERRREEIHAAAQAIEVGNPPQLVPVVPVRMTEAWLLVSEAAIRSAAANPHGRVRLNLPDTGRLEALPDPKAVLEDLLLEASELNRRRRKKFSFPTARARIPDFFEDFEILLRLPSARRLFDEIQALTLPRLEID